MATTVATTESTEQVVPAVEQSAEASLEADETQDASETSEDESNDESTDAESEDSKEDRPKKKESGYEKRIRKLTKQRGDAQRELDYWKAEALRKAQSAQEPKSEEPREKKQSLEGKPKAEEFESHAEFVEALADWKYEQRKALDEVKQKETQIKTEFQKNVESFQSKVKDFSKAHKDFQEVISDVDDIPMSIGVQETLLASDVGPELMYELAKDRENYERINALTPLSAARELGRIEARIHANKESSSQEPKKQSSAPTPLKPVGKHGSGGVKKSLSDPSLSYADFEKLRREELRAKRR
jgi:hypothetical protein